MRIRDRIMLDGYREPSVIEGRINRGALMAYLREATSFIIDNVCDLVEERGSVGFDDIPNAAPPYPIMWFEGHCGDRFGMLVLANTTPMPRERITTGPTSVLELPARWWLTGYLFREDRGSIIGPWYPIIVAVGVQGEPLTAQDEQMLILGPDGSEESKPMSAAVELLFQVCLLAISFTHCRSVHQQDAEGETPCRQERRRMQRAGVARTRFKVLQIGKIRKVLDRQGGAATYGLKRALHICRGHFAHYGEERPLFGKYTGTFWIPDHVRGTTEAGTVNKEYDVQPPTPGEPDRGDRPPQLGEAA